MKGNETLVGVRDKGDPVSHDRREPLFTGSSEGCLVPGPGRGPSGLQYEDSGVARRVNGRRGPRPEWVGLEWEANTAKTCAPQGVQRRNEIQLGGCVGVGGGRSGRTSRRLPRKSRELERAMKGTSEKVPVRRAS